MIPRPGEVGHETWLNEARRFSGDMSTWAPASADPSWACISGYECPTVQAYAGHRPGDNL